MAYLAIGLFEYLVVDVGRNKVLAVEDGVFGVAYEILLGREACYDFVVVDGDDGGRCPVAGFVHNDFTAAILESTATRF
jgi:hypothetical protein